MAPTSPRLHGETLWRQPIPESLDCAAAALRLRENPPGTIDRSIVMLGFADA
jgi:hypothetical protein